MPCLERVLQAVIHPVHIGNRHHVDEGRELGGGGSGGAVSCM
jgi:hypothetical protein